MCITYRFYHFCGHTHRIITFPCRNTRMALKMYASPEDEILSSLPVSSPASHQPTCVFDTADSAEEIRLFPTLCTKCEQVGVISQWLNCTPGGRFEVIRAWNKTHRHGVRTERTFESEIAEPKCFDHESDTESDATAARSYRTAVENQHSSIMLIDPPSRPPRPYGGRPNSSCLAQKIESLKSRVRERLAEQTKEVKTDDGRGDVKHCIEDK